MHFDCGSKKVISSNCSVRRFQMTLSLFRCFTVISCLLAVRFKVGAVNLSRSNPQSGNTGTLENADSISSESHAMDSPSKNRQPPLTPLVFYHQMPGADLHSKVQDSAGQELFEELPAEISSYARRKKPGSFLNAGGLSLQPVSGLQIPKASFVGKPYTISYLVMCVLSIVLSAAFTAALIIWRLRRSADRSGNVMVSRKRPVVYIQTSRKPFLDAEKIVGGKRPTESRDVPLKEVGCGPTHLAEELMEAPQLVQLVDTRDVEMGTV